MVVRNKCRNKNYAQQQNMDSCIKRPMVFFFFFGFEEGERFFGLFGFFIASNVFPQDVLNSTTLLSHMLCPKFSPKILPFHI
jgi:hypothetical protein